MDLVSKVRDLRRDLERRLESLSMWYQGSDDWKEGNQTLEEIKMIEKYIQYLREMEDYLE